MGHPGVGEGERQRQKLTEPQLFSPYYRGGSVLTAPDVLRMIGKMVVRHHGELFISGMGAGEGE